MLNKFITTVSILLLGSAVFADEIVFTNGERLIGSVVRMEDGKLTFTSESAGEVKVDMKRIKHFSTEKPVDIHLQDGSVIKSNELIREDDETAMTVYGIEQEQTIDMGALAAIYTKPKPRIAWARSITAGATSSRGNSDSTQANVALDILARSAKHRLRIKGLFLYGREENPDADDDPDADDEITTEENFTISAKYDYFFSKKLFGFISGSYKKDHIDDLDYRIITAAGVGRQWWESSIFQFSTDAGVSLVKEKYTTRKYYQLQAAPDENGNIAGTITRYRTVVDRNNDLGLQFGYALGWNPSDKLQFYSNLSYSPSLDDFSDYFLAADAEMRAAINKKLFSSFKMILDYDPTPGEGISSTEMKYILGLGLNF